MPTTFDSRNQRVIVSDEAGNETIYTSEAAWYSAGGKLGSWPKPAEPLTVDQQIAEINQECQEHIFKKYPITKQLSYSQGLYPLAERDACAQYINDCITESNRLSDCILAGTAAIPNWPI